jgi:hypothetical protein
VRAVIGATVAAMDLLGGALSSGSDDDDYGGEAPLT